MHPDGAEGTSGVSSRPGTDGADEKDGKAPEPEGKPGEGTDVTHIDEVEGDEPLLPARVHRPSDLMRLLVGLLAIGVLLAIAAFAHGTTSGLEQDINKGTGQRPTCSSRSPGWPRASRSCWCRSPSRSSG